MTADDWDRSNDPLAMLPSLGFWLSDRKARLLVCELSRQAKFRKPHVRRSIELGERLADGLATTEEVVTFSRATLKSYPGSEWTVLGADAAHSLRVALTTNPRYRPSAPTLLREIFGNPFRPVVFSPEWRTSTAVAIAQQMYESRDFGAMPILADALQDAGCDSDDILNHCRRPGEHVRGCWAVDLVLGRS